jgi:DNA-binding GntR family transcriptional regulator
LALTATAAKEETMRASDRVYAALRRDIIEWKLPPGTVLAEVEQADLLERSRVAQAVQPVMAEPGVHCLCVRER